MKKPKKVVGKYVYSTKSNLPHSEGVQQTPSDLPEQLGFFELAKNLENSLITLYKSGRPIVTANEWDFRLSLCRSCEHWEELHPSRLARCKKCGCSSGKMLLKTSQCPLSPPKW